MGLLYTKMKIFHFRNKIESLPEEVNLIEPPVQVRIKPTNVCGHNCWYCAYRAENLQLGKDMKINDYIPKDKMFEIIDDMENIGVKAVTFSGGGDPFYYPYFLETLQKLSKASVKFAALTNGARLQGKTAEIFAKHGTWIRVSIDGWDDKSYSDYRKVSDGEFTNVMNNMEAFKKLNGECYLGVCIVVDKDNSSHIYNIINKLRDIGVNSVKVAPCIVSNRGSENNDYHAVISKTVKEQTDKAVSDFCNGRFEIFDSYHTQLETFSKEYEWCPYLQIVPVIGADLNVYPCHDKAYNLDDGLLGSLKDMTFKEFWFSEKSNFFKVNPSRHCNHHCVADKNNQLLLEYLSAEKEHLAFV